MKSKIIIPFVIALLIVACSLTPSQESQINSLVATVAPLVQSYAQTGQISYAQTIPIALNSLAIFDPSVAVDTTQLAMGIENAVSIFTNGTGKSTGQKIASAVISALPENPTGEQANAALINAGIGASNGANP